MIWECFSPMASQQNCFPEISRLHFVPLEMTEPTRHFDRSVMKWSVVEKSPAIFNINCKKLQ